MTRRARAVALTILALGSVLAAMAFYCCLRTYERDPSTGHVTIRWGHLQRSYTGSPVTDEFFAVTNPSDVPLSARKRFFGECSKWLRPVEEIEVWIREDL